MNLSNHVFIIGNGGSYANAIHICNDLLSKGVKAFTIDPSTLTAFANDHGYENAFSLWLSVVGEKDDLLICLSGSGKSKNILNAIETAKRKEMEVLRLFGADLGQDMQRAEEHQLEWGHQLWKSI